MSTTTGKISQLPSITTVNGSEFIELVKRDTDGNLKNYKVLLRSLRSELGLSAYDNAVKNGFVGSEEEWLASLKGEDAFALAVKAGFEGDIEEWLESLKGKAGLSAFEAAVAGGYTGTEAEFNTSLSNVGEGTGGSGVGGAVFITDIVPQSSADNTGNKVRSEDGFSLVSCSTTTSDVKVSITAVTGHSNYRPRVTVNETPVTLKAGSIPLLWTGVVDLGIETSGASMLIAKHEDGAMSTAMATMQEAPKVLTAVFNKAYPGTQSELKAGDFTAIEFTTDVDVIAYEIKNEGALVASNGVLTSGKVHSVNNVSIADRGNVAQLLPMIIRVKESSGAWSDWFDSSIEAAVENVNVVKLNNLKPTVTIGKVTYPEGKTGLNEGDVATIINSVEDFSSVKYSSANDQLTINEDTVSESPKSVTAKVAAYNDTVNNFTIVATREENGSTTTKSTVVQLAGTAPKLSVTLPAARLRSGGNNGTTEQKHVVTLTSDQALVEEPSMTLPSAKWEGVWTTNSTRKVWKRTMVVHDDDVKGVYVFGDVKGTGMSGLVTTELTGTKTYELGGFVMRMFAIASYPNRNGDIGTTVVDTSKLRCSNLSKGQSGSFNHKYKATTDNEVGFYTIIEDGKTWYNCDLPNASSNTSGVAKIELEELV